jgi:hypothetical protein
MSDYESTNVAREIVIPSRSRRRGTSQLQEARAPECTRELAAEGSFIVCAIQDDSVAR